MKYIQKQFTDGYGTVHADAVHTVDIESSSMVKQEVKLRVTSYSSLTSLQENPMRNVGVVRGNGVVLTAKGAEQYAAAMSDPYEFVKTCTFAPGKEPKNQKFFEGEETLEV